jgi:NIMA (never in mitosis gene a)-related kinase
MEQCGSLKDFEVVRKLGEGAFGQVFMVRRKIDGQTYAMKKVRIGAMKDKEKDNALNEIRILASLNH